LHRKARAPPEGCGAWYLIKFVFFFSGHGDQVTDENGDENDNKDEALAAYDRRIIDDELPPLWAKFRPGVRILMISDTCNSGTIFRGQARRVEGFSLEAPLQINASLIHLAATHDSTDTPGAAGGSVFTNALLKVWNNGSFQGDYTEFLSQIKNLTRAPRKIRALQCFCVHEKAANRAA